MYHWSVYFDRIQGFRGEAMKPIQNVEEIVVISVSHLGHVNFGHRIQRYILKVPGFQVIFGHLR